MVDTTAPGAIPVRRPEFDFRDPGRLTKVVSVLLIAGAVVNLLMVASNAIQYAIIESRALYDSDIWTAIQALLVLLDVALLVITAIPFLMWVYRANRNGHALGAVGMKYRPGWAVGWYFVPIASLWMPFQVMREIWRVSLNPGDWQNAPSSPLVGWWWALYLIKSFSASFSYGLGNGDAVQVVNVALPAILANLVSAIGSLVAWRLLRRIAANQYYQANIAQVF